MIAILLAAGYATRMYTLTTTIPKTLFKVCGRHIIDYICDEIDTIPDIEKILLISNAKYFEKHLEWAKDRKISKTHSTNIIVLNDGSETESSKLGAIRDINYVIQQEVINDDILVIAGDSFFTYRLFDFYKYFKINNLDCVVVTKEENIEELKRGGVVTITLNNLIVDFEEKPENPKSKLSACACYIFKKETLPHFETYLNNKNNSDAPGYFIEWLYMHNKVLAYHPCGEFYDIGTPEAYEYIKKLFNDFERYI